MDTGLQALGRAGNRAAAILIALCIAFATAGPDLLRASTPRQSCCRLKHACACHTGHSSNGQLAWSATPNCSNDCRQLAKVTSNWIGAVTGSRPLTATLPDYEVAIYDGSRRVETQQNTSLYQRPPPRTV
jgi:hypothetical protein